MKITRQQLEHYCRTLIPGGYNPWRGAEAFTFDIAAAMRVIEFFTECLTFSNAEWAGRSFELQPWQIAILGNLFGWKRADGTRRYRKAFLFLAKKQGKTELVAGLANYLLFADDESAPELVAAAANADQASILFRAAAKMVAAESYLASRSEVLTRSIRCTTNGGSFKVINSAAKSKHGGNLHAALIDELFAIDDPALVDAVETSMAARRQPLLIYLTTAGDDPTTICGEIYDNACKVRDGLQDDAEFLPVIYEAGKDDAPGDPATWRKAAPSLGITVAESVYAKEYQDALQTPRKMLVFRQFRLNQWVAAGSAWIGLEDWKQCAGPVALDIFKGKPVYVGIDLSATQDTTAVVLAARDGDHIICLPLIFLPEENTAGQFRRAKRDKAPYVQWIEQGHIIATPGNAVDQEFVAAKILEVIEGLDIQEVQMDPWQSGYISDALQKAGLTVTLTRQGVSLSPATKELEKLILSKQLRHPNNPAMNWQASNVVVHSDRMENIWPDKAKSTRRIDSIAALINAINGMYFGVGRQGAGAVDSYYVNNPELIVLD